MSAALFRKKPLPVEARQVVGCDTGQAGRDLAAWCGGSVGGSYAEPKVFVPTLEGELVARVGDWIVKGPRGEFWPVKGDIFAETYEPALAAQAEGQEPVVEYGVYVPDSAWPKDGVLLDGDTFDRADQEARLERYRCSWPNAALVQRSVRRGEWTETAS